MIEEALVMELGSLSGRLRSPGGRGSRQQYKIGKVEEENRELGLTQVYNLFPGAAEAWAEVAPELFPDHPFSDDPQSMLSSSLWFSIGGQLRVAFREMPQMELAEWDPGRDDWIELEPGAMAGAA